MYISLYNNNLFCWIVLEQKERDNRNMNFFVILVMIIGSCIWVYFTSRKETREGFAEVLHAIIDGAPYVSLIIFVLLGFYFHTLLFFLIGLTIFVSLIIGVKR